MACRLYDIKPLSTPVPYYCHFDHVKEISVKMNKNATFIHENKLDRNTQDEQIQHRSYWWPGFLHRQAMSTHNLLYKKNSSLLPIGQDSKCPHIVNWFKL